MTKIRLLLLGLVIFLFSCTPDHHQPDPILRPKPLTAFTVNVVSRGFNLAVISWSESTNNYTVDTVKYKVVLGNKLNSQDRIIRMDTIQNLHPDSTYTGRVYAYTKSGDTASAGFVLQKLEGYMLDIEHLFDHQLTCYAVSSGQRIWATEDTHGAEKFVSGLTVIDSTIYTATGGGAAVALNLKTGKERWRTTLVGSTLSTPRNVLYKNEKVFVAPAEGIYALNSKTGKVEWNYPFPTPAPGIWINPVIGGDLMFITYDISAERKMTAININTGVKVWEAETNSQLCLSPLVYQEDLLIYSNWAGKVEARRQQTGELVWMRDFSVYYNNYGSAFVSPCLYNDIVIVHNGNSGFYGLNAKTGATIWNFPEAHGPNVSAPSVGNGLVYFVVDGSEYVLDAATGIKIRKEILSGPNSVNSQPGMLINDLLYSSVGHPYSGVLVREPKTGAEVRRHHFDGQLVGLGLLILDNKAYYSSDTGLVQ